MTSDRKHQSAPDERWAQSTAYQQQPKQQQQQQQQQKQHATYLGLFYGGNRDEKCARELVQTGVEVEAEVAIVR